MTERAARGTMTVRREGVTERKGHGAGASTARFAGAIAVATPILAFVAGFAFAGIFRFGEAGPANAVAAVAVGALLCLALLALSGRAPGAFWNRGDALEDRAEEMKRGYQSIVALLCAAMDLRDSVSQGQARRVSEIASVVAWEMGLRKEDLRRIEKAVILHDVGKIGVPDAILAKPGPLDEAEWAEMKRHPELGFQMLQGIDFLKEAAEIVYAHHEHYDGSGYPRGLREDEIPLGARIFAVVDAYNAMTSHRPYRKARPHRTAVEEIVRNSGTQFDPDVVRAFMEAAKRGLLEEERPEGLSGARRSRAETETTRAPARD